MNNAFNKILNERKNIMYLNNLQIKMKSTILSILCILITLLISIESYAQKVDEKEGLKSNLFRITENTSQDSIQQFLVKCNASELKFNSNKKSFYPIRIKRNKNWLLMSEIWDFIEYDSNEKDGDIDHIKKFKGYQIHEIDNYSLEFPDSSFNVLSDNITTATRKGKKFLARINEKEVYKDIWFDELKIQMQNDTIEGYELDENGDEILTMYVSPILKQLELKRGHNLALAYLDETSMYQLSGFHFLENKLPDSLINKYKSYNYYEELVVDTIKAKLANDFFISNPEIDIAFPLWSINEKDLLFQTRNFETKLWSVVAPSIKNTSNLVFPTSVNKVIVHDNYFTILEVWKDNLVGFYNSTMTKNQPCEFDAFKIVNLDYMNAIALKKNDEWFLYNPENCNKLFDASAKTTNELIDLWFNRNN